MQDERASFVRETQEAVDSYKLTIEDLQREMDEMIAGAGVLEHRVMTAERDRDEAVAASVELRQRLEQLGKDAAEVSRRAAEADRNCDGLLTESAELREEAESLRRALEGAEGVTARVQQERDEAVASAEELRAALVREGERGSAAEERLSRAQQELVQALEAASDLRKKVEDEVASKVRCSWKHPRVPEAVCCVLGAEALRQSEIWVSSVESCRWGDGGGGVVGDR